MGEDELALCNRWLDRLRSTLVSLLLFRPLFFASALVAFFFFFLFVFLVIRLCSTAWRYGDIERLGAAWQYSQRYGIPENVAM